ncbi:efflux RND transporter periplasmic adaptor subunit [Sphingomonas sp. CCH5-D11]|jgi:multidrug efflux system membrane fusion protein|uniref:efflux RND transporter periplasmic adaptor subunit n=1 Tax=Sphingomonas sp. CCH5-D11 TaxID=1768786 RepID=UPI00082ED804|nr:efflux RND transporter periplasmic adaptor subunit [Sphingomonas sp. CCH5-D11]
MTRSHVLPVLSALALAACAEEAPPPEVPPTALVAVAEPASDPRGIVTGIIRSGRTHQVATETGGRVVRLSAAIGDRVEAGTVLATLDTQGLALALDSARADEARLAAQAEERRRRAGRFQTLDGSGSVSRAEADAARAEALAADQALAAARSQRAEAARRLGTATLRAPASGVIVSRQAELSAQLQPGAVLFEIEPDGAREIVSPVPAQALADLTGSGFTQFRFSGETGTARFLGVSARASATGAREARFAVVGGSPPIGAAVELSLGSAGETGVSVPAAALVNDRSGRAGLFVVGPGNKLRLVPVSLLELVAGRAIVTGEVRAGSQIVSAGGNFLTSDMVVRPVRATR